MENTIENHDNMIQRNQKWNLKLSKITRVILILLFLFAIGQFQSTTAQMVKHPQSEVTTTAKHYSYKYKISESQYKMIEYILVRASNGDIKSTFNACDVCYPSHKGYSQSGTKLRCNNCGNTFEIDALGSQGSGGCWPGHLVHSLDGDSVVVTAPELYKGEYFFLMLISGVNDSPDNLFSIENTDNVNLSVRLKDSNLKNFKVLDLNGNMCKNISYSSNEFNLDISDLSSGLYFVLAEFNGQPVSKRFYITR